MNEGLEKDKDLQACYDDLVYDLRSCILKSIHKLNEQQIEENDCHFMITSALAESLGTYVRFLRSKKDEIDIDWIKILKECMEIINEQMSSD